jgi:hypothetical protein
MVVSNKHGTKPSSPCPCRNKIKAAAMSESSLLKRRNQDLSLESELGRRDTRWFGASQTFSRPRTAPRPNDTTQVPPAQIIHTRKTARDLPTTPPRLSAASTAEPTIRSVQKTEPISTSSHTGALLRLEPTDPWTQYERAYAVIAGREATLAYKDNNSYLVYSVLDANQTFQLWALKTLSNFGRPVFLQVHAAFSSSALETLVVTEYLDVSLADVAVCELDPSEDELASISSQARRKPTRDGPWLISTRYWVP